MSRRLPLPAGRGPGPEGEGAQTAGRSRGTIAAMYDHLPGGDLVQAGLRDLERGIESTNALLVASFATRLRREGVAVPEHAFADPEHRLYELLAREDPDSAHGRYNALVRRLVSFARALPCEN